MDVRTPLVCVNSLPRARRLDRLTENIKRQHDGAFDYAAAHAWARDPTGQLRESLVVMADQGGHSEVLGAILDQTTAALALIVSHAPNDTNQVAKLEDALVRRHVASTIELATDILLKSSSRPCGRWRRSTPSVYSRSAACRAHRRREMDQPLPQAQTGQGFRNK